MQLYLLRHADADTEAPSDAERELSGKGVEQASRVASFCSAYKLKVDVILSSPLIRAQQTAKRVAEKLRVDLRTADWLASGASAVGIVSELAGLRKVDSVMLVGHEPDLSALVAHLLGASRREVILIRKASLTAIEVLAFRAGGGRLDFSIPAKLM